MARIKIEKSPVLVFATSLAVSHTTISSLYTSHHFNKYPSPSYIKCIMKFMTLRENVRSDLLDELVTSTLGYCYEEIKMVGN